MRRLGTLKGPVSMGTLDETGKPRNHGRPDNHGRTG